MNTCSEVTKNNEIANASAKVEQTIRIDIDTLNEGANTVALKAAIVAEFPGSDVVVKSTGRGTEVKGFADNDATRAALRIVIERADF